VDQWVEHLQQRAGLMDAMSLSEARDNWSFGDPLPGVLVFTYSSLVSAMRVANDHAARALRGEAEMPEASEHRLVWWLLSVPFGALILDEMHMAVADQWIGATKLRANVIFGLSGSLIREDERLSRMRHVLGPVVYSHVDERSVNYEIVRVPLHPDVSAAFVGSRVHSAHQSAACALSPWKMTILRKLLERHRNDRVIIFCDSRRGAELLVSHVLNPGVFLMHGGVNDEERLKILQGFEAKTRDSILVSTRVCDAGVDFPDGCVIVQLFVANGGRQQEVQRCGRGSRGMGATNSRVFHIVNSGTEEETYVSRRVQHVCARFPKSNVTYVDADVADYAEKDACGFRALTTLRIASSSDTAKRRQRKLKHQFLCLNPTRKRARTG
jgi:superfamily II DNA or RNA helicase